MFFEFKVVVYQRFWRFGHILPWHTNIIFFIVESPLFSDGLIITYVSTNSNLFVAKGQVL